MIHILLLLLIVIISLPSQAKLKEDLYPNLHSNQGSIIVKLKLEKTPLTVINFVGLVQRENTQISKLKYLFTIA